MITNGDRGLCWYRECSLIRLHLKAELLTSHFHTSYHTLFYTRVISVCAHEEKKCQKMAGPAYERVSVFLEATMLDVDLEQSSQRQ